MVAEGSLLFSIIALPRCLFTILLSELLYIIETELDCWDDFSFNKYKKLVDAVLHYPIMRLSTFLRFVAEILFPSNENRCCWTVRENVKDIYIELIVLPQNMLSSVLLKTYVSLVSIFLGDCKILFSISRLIIARRCVD